MRPPRDAYKLTVKGRDLWKVVTALREWGDRWDASGFGAPTIEVVDRDTGRELRLALVDPDTGQAVTGQRIEYRPGPGADDAVGGAFGRFQDTNPETLQRNFEINTLALLHLAQLTTPAMIAAGEGALIVTGNTSAQRGKANFAGFAPTKAAQRILAESLARDLGPRGVHVAYLIIDAVIDVPWARERFKEAPADFFIQPASIAAEVFHLAHQPRDAWSFLAEVRPFREEW